MHDQQSVGQRQQLVEVLGDEQDRCPGLPLGHQKVLDGLHALDVQATCGLGSHHNPGPVHQLAAHQEALEVAAGQPRYRFFQRTDTNAEPVHEVAAMVGGTRRVEEQATTVPAIGPQDSVVGHAEPGRQSDSEPILRDVAQPISEALPRCGIGPVLTAQLDRPRLHRPQACDGLCHLPLTVSGHAGNAHDLARTHCQVQAIEGRQSPVVGTTEVPNFEQHLSDLPGRWPFGDDR